MADTWGAWRIQRTPPAGRWPCALPNWMVGLWIEETTVTWGVVGIDELHICLKPLLAGAWAQKLARLPRLDDVWRRCRCCRLHRCWVLMIMGSATRCRGVAACNWAIYSRPTRPGGGRSPAGANPLSRQRPRSSFSTVVWKPLGVALLIPNRDGAAIRSPCYSRAAQGQAAVAFAVETMVEPWLFLAVPAENHVAARSQTRSPSFPPALGDAGVCQEPR